MKATASRRCANSTHSADYAEWVERLRNTYVSVAHCCRYRLAGHPDGPNRVGLDVVAGLLERPRVFQYFGLPFSGRVGHLAEQTIAAIRSGADARASVAWDDVERRLHAITDELQQVVVAACVDGHEGEKLAAVLCVSMNEAEERRAATLGALRGIAADIRRPSTA